MRNELLEALIYLLIEKGVFTKEEFHAKVKWVHTNYFRIIRCQYKDCGCQAGKNTHCADCLKWKMGDHV